ncbi:MAG: decaprenyl-phosphate phosphoribosyltransferase [Chloroflexi bacterium]|nr:decaprenyl-phosphate phosphoribosyltransferase [Chloroflexota bacterium]
MSDEAGSAGSPAPHVPPSPGRRGLALVRALRPKQWAKNLLVFAGLVFTYNLLNPGMLSRVALAFVVFCALSSAGYIWNDLRDVAADRLHPHKRHRPIASGQVPPALAVALGLVLGVAGLGLAVALGTSFALVASLYMLLTVTYSIWLKHLVLIDVFGISAGFVLRAVAGAVVIGVPVSPWLYFCTVLASLFLALGKRRNELELLASGAAGHRKNLEQYSLELVDQLILIVASVTIMAYSLYTFSAENLPRDHSMMLTIPVVVYGIFRYLYLVRVKRQGGAPEDLLLTDPGIFGTAVCWVGLSVIILYVLPH